MRRSSSVISWFLFMALIIKDPVTDELESRIDNITLVAHHLNGVVTLHIRLHFNPRCYHTIDGQPLVRICPKYQFLFLPVPLVMSVNNKERLGLHRWEVLLQTFQEQDESRRRVDGGRLILKGAHYIVRL